MAVGGEILNLENRPFHQAEETVIQGHPLRCQNRVQVEKVQASLCQEAFRSKPKQVCAKKPFGCRDVETW